MFYTVKWVIEVDAETPKEAAEKALAIQRKPDIIATVFDVSWMETTRLPSGETYSVRHEQVDLTP